MVRASTAAGRKSGYAAHRKAGQESRPSLRGFYNSHPDAVYFNVGKIGENQLTDLAKRRGMAEVELQRLLAPNL